MTQFPTYIQVLAPNYSETYQTNYMRSDFERGVAKQRKIACNVLKQVSFNGVVCDENYQDFVEFWRDIGQEWFEFNDPATTPVIKKKARILAGSLQTAPQGEGFDFWNFTLVLEMYA